ncbi:MAG TPA: selenocysteine-specific translation elongation factor [Clostridia bacterium]|nr:selenocysteine-specific translation elongation factor [Clostridia bacterium]
MDPTNSDINQRQPKTQTPVGADPPDRYVVIGTAGHIDHGKTALVRVLTGQETDRLPEEKARGISIDLGFAYFSLPNGVMAAIVDVPGHERFIRNMIAGASGIDVALLVVAANEGIMPQTVEHFDILKLLGIQRGLTVLTKVDIADADQAKKTLDDVRRLIKGTFLENAPVIPVSSVTGQGLDHLLHALSTVTEELPPKEGVGVTQMPIDRAFAVPGFGLVVTGTVTHGRIVTGDTLQILPPGIEARVRGLQVHRSEVNQVREGMRTAVNLTGPDLDAAAVKRGMVLAAPGLLSPLRYFVADLTLLESADRPLATGSRVRLHVGTSEVMARITLLDQERLNPGESGYARIKTESEVVLTPRTRFIIRSYSPVTTIGGGVVLDIHGHYRRFDKAGISFLHKMHSASSQDIVSLEIQRHLRPISLMDVVKRTGLSPGFVGKVIDEKMRNGEIVCLDKTDAFLASSTLDALYEQMTRALTEFHRTSRLTKGMKMEDLRSAVAADWNPRSFADLVGLLAQRNALLLHGDVVSLPHLAPRLTEAEEMARTQIIKAFAEGGFKPPSISEAIAKAGVDPRTGREIAAMLEKDGVIVRVQGDMAFHSSWVAEAARRLVDYLSRNKTITVAQFKDLTGTTRKYALPLLSYFDTTRLTRRVGDVRVLRKEPTSSR